MVKETTELTTGSHNKLVSDTMDDISEMATPVWSHKIEVDAYSTHPQPSLSNDEEMASGYPGKPLLNTTIEYSNSLLERIENLMVNMNQVLVGTQNSLARVSDSAFVEGRNRPCSFRA
jgi:hypothetical protein